MQAAQPATSACPHNNTNHVTHSTLQHVSNISHFPHKAVA